MNWIVLNIGRQLCRDPQGAALVANKVRVKAAISDGLAAKRSWRDASSLAVGFDFPDQFLFGHADHIGTIVPYGQGTIVAYPENPLWPTN